MYENRGELRNCNSGSCGEWGAGTDPVWHRVFVAFNITPRGWIGTGSHCSSQFGCDSVLRTSLFSVLIWIRPTIPMKPVRTTRSSSISAEQVDQAVYLG